jgi:hypothetical protein
MPLKAGTKAPVSNGYGGSMAEAIETAFMAQWPYVMGDADVPASNDQMKLLFIAVAQGVVNHLKQNSASMKVTVTVNVGGTSYNGTGTVSNIEII